MGKYQDDKYRPHTPTGRGNKGYKYMQCPNCGKRGVSSRVWSSHNKAIARKVCRYCGWFERS